MHAPQHYKVISDQANVRANTSVDQLDKCIQVEICRQTSERLSVLHIGVSLLEACTSIQVEIRCQTSERRSSGLHTGVSSLEACMITTQQRMNTKQYYRVAAHSPEKEFPIDAHS